MMMENWNAVKQKIVRAECLGRAPIKRLLGKKVRKIGYLYTASAVVPSGDKAFFGLTGCRADAH